MLCNGSDKTITNCSQRKNIMLWIKCPRKLTGLWNTVILEYSYTGIRYTEREKGLVTVASAKKL